jgi:hypothetical protein
MPVFFGGTPGAFLGGTIGSMIGMLLLCIFIYRVGPKKLPVNFFLQVILSGLFT